MATSYLHRHKLPSDPDEHSQLLRSMYQSPADIEQAILRQQMADAARQAARYGGRTLGAFPLVNPKVVSVPTETDPAESYLSDLPRPPKPRFMLATDRRAAERVEPVSTWNEPEVLMPDDYHHSEAKWRCLVRKETILDVDGMEASRARDRQLVLQDQQGLELQTLLAEEDEPETLEEASARFGAMGQNHPAHGIQKEEAATLRSPRGNGNSAAGGRKSRGSPAALPGRAVASSGYGARLKTPISSTSSSVNPSPGGSPTTTTTTIIRPQKNPPAAAAHAPPWQPQSAANAQLQIQQQLAAAGHQGMLPVQSNALTASAVRYSAVGVPIGQTPLSQPPQLQIQSRPGTSSGVIISLPPTPRNPVAAATAAASSHQATLTPRSASLAAPGDRLPSPLLSRQSSEEKSTPHSPSFQSSFPSGSLSPTALARISHREERRFREGERNEVFRLNGTEMGGNTSPRKQTQQQQQQTDQPSASPLKSPPSDLLSQLRDAQAALAASQAETAVLKQRLAELEPSTTSMSVVVSPNPDASPGLSSRPQLPRPPSHPSVGSSAVDDGPDASVSRALGRASLNLRQARRSLTEDKMKLMNEQIELARQKEAIEREKMEITEQQQRASVPSSPTMSPQSHPTGSSSQTSTEESQAAMMRALARQNVALKTSRKSLTEEKLRLQNEFVKVQGEKREAEEKATGLERRLSASAGASPSMPGASSAMFPQYPGGSPNSDGSLSLPPLPHAHHPPSHPAGETPSGATSRRHSLTIPLAAVHGEDDRTTSVLRAVARQSLTMRKERRSLTEEKTKYMNEALAKEKAEAQEKVAELEKKLQESLHHLNTPSGSPDGGTGSPNPAALTEEQERLAAVQRASLAQLTRLKSARASARSSYNAERDSLLKDTLKLEGDKALHLEALQSQMHQLEVERAAHVQQIADQQESLRREHAELQQARDQAAAAERAALAAAAAATDATKAASELEQMRKALDAERASRAEEVARIQAELSKERQSAHADRLSRTDELDRLQADLRKERQARADDSKRMDAFVHAGKQHAATLELVAHLQSTNATLLAEVKSFQATKQRVIDTQKELDAKESEMKKADQAREKMEQEAKAKWQQQETDAAAQKEALRLELVRLRQTFDEELAAQKKAHDAALSEEILTTRASLNTTAQSLHSQHSILWTSERETLLKLFEQDCEDQRQKMALDHHFHVSKERAELKTAMNQLERERVKFETDKRRFIDQHPGFGANTSGGPTSSGGGVGRQPTSWSKPTAVQTAHEDHRATLAHQATTAASLAHLSAAIGSGNAGIQAATGANAAHSHSAANLTAPDSPTPGPHSRSQSPQPALQPLTPRDGKTTTAARHLTSHSSASARAPSTSPTTESAQL